MTIIKEITEDKPFLIVNKPTGIPSAPLTSEDKNNAFSILAEQFPQLLEVKGRKEIEHGLLHRIDTETSGLLIIAANQDCYEKLLLLQKENKIKKYYTASCNTNSDINSSIDGFPVPEVLFSKTTDKYFLESYFRFYGEGRKSVRPVTKNSNVAALKKLGKPVLYSTDVNVIDITNEIVKVEACITNGFRHQVRCHLAWMGLPIVGDKLYNPNASTDLLQFCASKIDINGDIYTL